MIFDLSEEPEEDEENCSPGLEHCSTQQLSQQSLSQSSAIIAQSSDLTSPQRKKRKEQPPSRAALLQKEMNAKARESEKEAREMLKASAKQTKAQEKMADLQRHGFYKTQELSLVLPEEVYSSSVGGAILSHLMFSPVNDKSYACLSAPSSVPGLCRWTFRNFLDGGSATVGEPAVVVIPFVVVLFPPREFLGLVEASRDGVEFPLLGQEMQQLRRKLPENGCRKTSKLVLLLIDIDEECKQYKQAQGRAPSLPGGFPPRSAPWSTKLDEAVAFLLYTANIDVVLRPSGGSEHKDVAKYFETVTRCLGDQAGQQRRMAGLNSIKKVAPRREGDATGGGSFTEDDHLQQVFSCMLQVVPGVSRLKAERVLEFYPFPQLLLEALNDPRVPEKDRRRLLADKLDVQRSNVKLAAQLFKVFTSLDPDEPL